MLFQKNIVKKYLSLLNEELVQEAWKKNISFSLFLLLSVTIMAQTQQGVAYRYNGRNARTPLGNVTISYDANKRSTISAENGTFALTLTGKQMGDRIGQVTVKKREMMVFNQQAVDEWSIRKEPLMLILCNADEFEKQKENLIAIGRREAKKKYDKQKADLEAQLNASKIKEAEYEAALDKAYEEMDRLNKNIGEYAELFARIDESEIDTLAQRAVELFNQGEVEEAIRLFEEGHYMEKLDKAITTSQQADQLMSVAEQAKAKATQDSIKAIESLRAQIEAYKVNNEWQKAGELLKGLADRLNTFDEVFDYAFFSDKQCNYKDAEDNYRKALMLLDSDDNYKGNGKLHIKAMCYCQLAGICSSMKRLEESENYYKLSYDCLESLKQQGEVYLGEIARIQGNLGAVYIRSNQLKEGANMLCKAIETYRKCDITNDFVVVSEIAGLGNTLKMLAVIYQITGRNDKCEALYSEAIDLLRKSAKANPYEYESTLANALRTMASLYLETQKYEECEQLLVESLEIVERLVSYNQKAYENDYAFTLKYLGELYLRTFRLPFSERMFKESLKIFRNLSRYAPMQYESHVAQTSSNLGLIKMIQDQYAEAIPFFEEALGIYQEKTEEEQLGIEGINFTEERNWLVSRLAISLLFQGEYEKSADIYRHYKNELKNYFLDDFKQFAEEGFIPKEREEDVERIKRMLNE